MRRLAQSTSYVVMLKVFLSSDHVTAATGKTVAITISKAGGAFGNPAAGATNATEVTSGWYKVTMGTGDTDTLGDLVVRGTATACDDSEQVAQVVKATNGGLTALPDAAAEAAGGLYTRGTGAGQINQPANGMVDANVVRNAGTAITAASGIQEVKVASIANGAIAAATFAANALDAVWSTATRLLTAGTNIVLAKGVGVTGFNDLSAAQVNAEADTALADYDAPTHAELTSGLAGADDAVLAQVALVKATTDKLDDTLEDDGGTFRFTANALEQAPTGGSAPSAADIRAEIDSNSTQLAAIVADTGELQTDWVNGGRLDLLVDGIKAKTDGLPSDPADASVITARFDTLDTSVADLPTNAELTTALGTADDAVLAQVALVKTQTDKLTFGVTNVLNSNVTHVNEIEVDGSGTTLDPWGPV